MDETSIDITSQSFDITRNELMWESREEDIIQKWMLDSSSRSVSHDLKAKKNKLLYSIFGIPCIMIPLILGGINSLIACHSIIYSVAMMISALFNACNLFFNFGKKQQSHSNFSNRFFELSRDIESELSMPKKTRVACSIFMERIKGRYIGLIKQAPTIRDYHR